MTAPDDQSVTDAPSTGLSRRSVVRVGAAAAWSVPVVAIATSAPALAASQRVLSHNGYELVNPDTRGGHYLRVVQIRNESDTYEAAGLQVVVEIPVGDGRLATAPELVGVNNGWEGSVTDRTYTATRIAPLAPGQRTNVRFRWRLAAGDRATLPGVPVSAVISAPGYPEIAIAASYLS